MKVHTLISNQWIPLPVERVFSFFADARNLEAITPEWLKFRIVAPESIVMKTGARIEYRLRLRGIPVQWESEITAWEPPFRFVDEQIRGPYRFWKHEHRFSVRDSGTEVMDDVRYSVLGGSVTNSLFVAPDLRKIFAYRRERLSQILK
jgi:ligand-binding SRPBCC domain-containing protein